MRQSHHIHAASRAVRGALIAGLAVFAIALVSAGCVGTRNAAGQGVTLVLGGYTTPREAYSRAIIPAFQKYWKEKTGQTVEFQESYQGSGAQARAIVGGFDADIAALSLEEDIDTIAKAGLITHDWRTATHGGMVSTSIVVLAVRQGNPKAIANWADLARPGLNVLTPDPSTSGGAKWNIAAMYGAALRGEAGVTRDDTAGAAQFLGSVFRNVTIMDKGARESITNFEKGVGDVAITYENEVLVGRQAGQTYDYVIPHSTLLIENPVAVVDKNAEKHGVKAVAEGFVAFLTTAEAQKAYAEYGLRPVDPDVARETAAKFPPVADLWTIKFLGGWPKVTSEIFGPDGIFPRTMQTIHGGK